MRLFSQIAAISSGRLANCLSSCFIMAPMIFCVDCWPGLGNHSIYRPTLCLSLWPCCVLSGRSPGTWIRNSENISFSQNYSRLLTYAMKVFPAPGSPQQHRHRLSGESDNHVKNSSCSRTHMPVLRRRLSRIEWCLLNGSKGESHSSILLE